MDRKYYVMGGSIIGVVLVLLISVMLLSSCNKKYSYSKIEDKLISAAEQAVSNGDVTVAENTEYAVTSDQLVQAGYIKSLDKLRNDNCSATVTITNNSGVYNYLPNLVCTGYSTTTLKQKVIDDNITTSKDGLYADAGEYIFKGKNPNNHLKFAGEDWLILKIDYSGNIRLINTKPADQIAQWDTKFNEQTNTMNGENEYETSSIHDLLDKRYKEFPDKLKKHIIPVSICIGARAPEDITKSNLADCSKKMDGQFLSIMNMSDYALASYDKDCSSMLAGSCMNYNFFPRYVEESWTLNVLNDSSYEVILYQQTRLIAEPANNSHKYHDVLYISGDEVYVEGDGSEENPYIIK